MPWFDWVHLDGTKCILVLRVKSMEIVVRQNDNIKKSNISHELAVLPCDFNWNHHVFNISFFANYWRYFVRSNQNILVSDITGNTCILHYDYSSTKRYLSIFKVILVSSYANYELTEPLNLYDININSYLHTFCLINAVLCSQFQILMN